MQNNSGNSRWLGTIAAAVAMICVPWSAGAATNDATRPALSCKFGRGQWNPDEWTMMRRPDEAGLHLWGQRDDCIENAAPVSTNPAAGAKTPWVY